MKLVAQTFSARIGNIAQDMNLQDIADKIYENINSLYINYLCI